ncbi:MAG: glycosyltransferase [Pseudonocardiaceae bacterium]|nr:glycosyltransferase [Pseudonocardiaceae bacterium]
MIPIWLLALLIFGVNFVVWGALGLARLAEERRAAAEERLAVRRGLGNVVPLSRMNLRDVAVLMAAHNEEVVIDASLSALARLIPAGNIYVVSDASTDRTVELAKAHGVNVIETASNVGKAGALQEGIDRFELATGYRAVLLLDADTRLDDGYFDTALPLFDDPSVVAVAGCARTDWNYGPRSFGSFVLTCHRSRIYALLQRLLKFGQTWRRTNATYIVPGFASMYRTRVLPHIDINPPGLVIEDFNMTFEVYRRHLGKVGFSLHAIAITQDPIRLADYVRQTKRWALGFWQTVRRFRPRLDLFTGMLTLSILELITASLLLITLPFVLVLLVIPELFGVMQGWPIIGPAYHTVGEYVDLTTIGLGVLLPDYLLTVIVAVLERRPRYLLGGLLSVPMRMLDAAITLYSLPRAWLERSTGRWVSPARRASIAQPDAAATVPHLMHAPERSEAQA